MRALLPLTLVLVLAACDAVGSPTTPTSSLSGGTASVAAEWCVTAVGAMGRPSPSTGAFTVTFAPSAELVGMAACSEFSGGYAADAWAASGSLRAEVKEVRLIPTFAPCFPEDDVFAEHFLGALRGVRSFRVSGRTAVLSGTGPDVRLER